MRTALQSSEPHNTDEKCLLLQLVHTSPHGQKSSVVARLAELCSKVNEGKVTEWMQLKWRLTILYIRPVLLSAARFFFKKKSRVYLPSAAPSAAPAPTCFPQFTENDHQGILLRFRLGNAHGSMGNVVQSVFIYSRSRQLFTWYEQITQVEKLWKMCSKHFF